MNLSSFFAKEDHNELTGVAYKNIRRKRNIISEMSKREESTINEISDLLNISVPTATELMVELLNEGLVIDTGKKSSGIGRKAAIYALASNCCYFLGVEIKKYKIKIGLMGFDKVMVATSPDIPFPFLDTRESLEAIIKQTKEFLDGIDIPKEKILGLGVSIAGRINVKTGQILTIYHFSDAPVKEILEDALEMPVYMDNDSRTVAYGEYHFGQAEHEPNALILNLDYGMALGIFVNGRPVYGASGYAGELGHIAMFNNEKICICGKKGCLETEASGAALISLITQKMQEGSNSILQNTLQQKGYLELEDVVAAINKGDNLAIEGITSIGDKLGRGLAVTINLFNPELIILAGTLSAVGELLLLPVKTAVFQHSLSLVNADTRISLSKINVGAGLPGCCLLVRDKILGIL